MKGRISTLVLLGFILAISACGGQEVKQEDLPAKYELLEAKVYFDQISKIKDVQLVDVRTPNEYSGGHIEGAVNYDYLAGNFAEQAKDLDPSRPVYLYCQAAVRSPKAAAELKEMGFKEVYDLKDGYRTWEPAGLPVSND